jgi:hypothetical protein
MALIGGIAAGADSIIDMARLRHGAMDRLFTGVRTPSSRGSRSAQESRKSASPAFTPWMNDVISWSV